MSAIHDLIAQVSDPRLRERLAAEWASATKEKKFGLVFEDHLPELLPLHKAKPRRGDLVCRRAGPIKDVWQVKQVRDGVATCSRPTIYKGPDDLRAPFFPAIPALRGVPARRAAGADSQGCSTSATFKARAVSFLCLACGYARRPTERNQ